MNFVPRAFCGDKQTKPCYSRKKLEAGVFHQLEIEDEQENNLSSFQMSVEVAACFLGLIRLKP